MPSLYPLFAVVPAVFFGAALLTDIAYWQTAEMMWSNFSAWMISAGVVMAYLAAVVGLVAFLRRPFLRSRTGLFVHAAATLLVLVLSTLNMLVHTRDAWSSVMPTGLLLSAATVIVVLIGGWIGWSSAYRHVLVEERS